MDTSWRVDCIRFLTDKPLFDKRLVFAEEHLWHFKFENTCVKRAVFAPGYAYAQPPGRDKMPECTRDRQRGSPEGWTLLGFTGVLPPQQKKIYILSVLLTRKPANWPTPCSHMKNSFSPPYLRIAPNQETHLIFSWPNISMK